jgi:hypothetical protein
MSPLYPPLHNSPADFAMNGHVAIPMPRSALPESTRGAGINNLPPPCPSPHCNHSTGPLLPSSPADFSPHPIHRRRTERRAKGSTCRVFFTIAVFCVGCLVVYFTLAHFYGTEAVPMTIGPDSSVGMYHRFPRSEPEPIIEMNEILTDFKVKSNEKIRRKSFLFTFLYFRIFIQSHCFRMEKTGFTAETYAFLVGSRVLRVSC